MFSNGDPIFYNQWYILASSLTVVLSDWHPGQPNHDGEEDCAVYAKYFNYEWGDFGCSAQCGAVCKIK